MVAVFRWTCGQVWLVAFALACGLCAHVGAVEGEMDASAVPASAPVAPSDAEAAAAFQAAQDQFKAMASGTNTPATVEQYEVAVFSDPTREFHPGSGNPKNVALADIRVVVDVEDMSLRNVVNEIVKQASEHSGMWTVKWRLKPEHAHLPEERVNLTAEAGFDDFVARLTERVRNMTGVGLYVTAFEASRVMLITDSFY